MVGVHAAGWWHAADWCMQHVAACMWSVGACAHDFVTVCATCMLWNWSNARAATQGRRRCVRRLVHGLFFWCHVSDMTVCLFVMCLPLVSLPLAPKGVPFLVERSM
jgi:hypothetical protein